MNIRSYISFDGRVQNNNCISFYDMYNKSDYGMIDWKQTLKDLEKTSDVAYHDILNRFDLIWGGVRDLIVTRRTLNPCLEGKASNEHRFLISTHVGLFMLGWLYFGFSCN